MRDNTMNNIENLGDAIIEILKIIIKIEIIKIIIETMILYFPF
jgi:hypothetical protein